MINPYRIQRPSFYVLAYTFFLEEQKNKNTYIRTIIETLKKVSFYFEERSQFATCFPFDMSAFLSSFHLGIRTSGQPEKQRSHDIWGLVGKDEIVANQIDLRRKITLKEE